MAFRKRVRCVKRSVRLGVKSSRCKYSYIFLSSSAILNVKLIVDILKVTVQKAYLPTHCCLPCLLRRSMWGRTEHENQYFRHFEGVTSVTYWTKNCVQVVVMICELLRSGVFLLQPGVLKVLAVIMNIGLHTGLHPK